MNTTTTKRSAYRMNPHRPRPRVAVAIASATVALVVAIPSPAVAHDDLVESSPAADSTVTTELEEVSLTFSDGLLDIGDSDGAFAIQVLGSDELYYNSDCVQRDGATATTSVALGGSGTYTVTWQVVSSDGHLTSDTFGFEYEKPVDTVAAGGAATAPCRLGDNDGAAAEGDGDAGAADPARSVTGIWVAGGGLVAFLAACAIVLAVIGARTRRARPPDDGQRPA